MKTLKKVNLLVSVTGFTIFAIGSILQLLNMSKESEVVIEGLNQLTYFGAIILDLSIFIWLTVLNHSIFMGWNWLKTKTKADDVAAVIMFIVCIPILLSLTIFVLYDLIIWFDWYTIDNYFTPLVDLVWSSLQDIKENMVFWYIFIALISIHSGFAIFLYKAKTQKIEALS